MEPHLRSDHDTGQGRQGVLGAGPPPELSAGEGVMDREDPDPDPTVQPKEVGWTGDEFVSLKESSLERDAERESVVSDGRASVESMHRSDESGRHQPDYANVADAKPKIVVELEDGECKDLGSSTDEDMDPLITVDTESQSSDLINFDTVSYDVIQQPSAEDDDDERSIATVSSLSCDIKLDSPAKHSQCSNSSSLVNLLDSSMKETCAAAESPSAQLLMDSMESAASSCPSSPSLQSSKTTSSAADESSSDVVNEQKVQDICDTPSDEPGADTCVPAGAPEEANDFQSVVCEADSSFSQLELTVDAEASSVMSVCEGDTLHVIENDVGLVQLPSDDMSSECSTESGRLQHQPSETNCALSRNDRSESFSVLEEIVSEIKGVQEIQTPEPADSMIATFILSEDSNASSFVSSTTEKVETAGSATVPRGDSEDSVETSSLDEKKMMPNVHSTSLPNEDISLEETISSSRGSLAYNEGSEKNISISEHESVLEMCDPSERTGTPSPVDSAVCVSTFATSEESTQLKSCDSSNETAELCSLEAISVISTEVLPPEHQMSLNDDDKISTLVVSPGLSSASTPCESSTLTERITGNGQELSSFQSSVNTDTNTSTLETLTLCSLEEKKLVEEENLDIGECTRPENINVTCAGGVEEESSASSVAKICKMSLSNSDMESVTDDVEKTLHSECDLRASENVLESQAVKTKRPTTLPDINSAKFEKMPSMNFSEFLGLFNAGSVSNSVTHKQYSASALDEAQQMATVLVDNILQMAVSKAEEHLVSCKNLTAKRVEVAQAAHTLIDGIFLAASPQTSCFEDQSRSDVMALQLACHEQVSQPSSVQVVSSDVGSLPPPGSISEVDSSPTVEQPEGLAAGDHVAEPAIKQVTSPLGNATPEIDLNVTDKYSSETLNLPEERCPFPESIPEVETPPIVVQPQPSIKEGSSSLSNTSSEMDLNASDKCSSETLNRSEDNSNTAPDACVKEDSVKSQSPENAGTDSVRSSDPGLRSEASLFVDGVLEEAVQKYEESSSSESSPVKLKRLNFDSDFTKNEEELATPCGEMLTEHFMDFESGRNVSVFCTLPENGSEDHLLAYDRTAHNIGNREVDSGTGKSVSVFRIEEDVYYEIQRPSTCTSVFESVEEEDEDMIDTTVPVEDRPNRTMKTSVSFPSFDRDKDCDAFEDAVGAFLAKEKLARDDKRRTVITEIKDSDEAATNPCRALVLKHPEIDISNQEEKKRMAEKWANGGESEVPDTLEMREKQRAIREALDSDEDVAVKLCKLALTEGGLINDSLRKEAWPRMLGLDPTLEIDAPVLEDLKSHPEYGQVVLDVNRSLKRFPPDIPKDQRETLQDKLTRLIMYVIAKHPHLRYYQGYHDVAVTFLLVVGESVAFQIMERLSTEHLSDCMQPTMERTSYLLHFIYPLLHRLHPTLADYLERSEVGTMFCLPWFLTWFGHSLDRYQDVVRLYDHFLASPPLAPLYVAAVLVAHRADEVLAVDCDMAAIHALLSRIPDSLPLEILLRDATELYLKFPPESIEREVEERFRNEQEMRNHEMEAREKIQRQRALRRRRGHSHGGGSWQLAEVNRLGGNMMAFNRWMPPWVVQQQRLSMRLLFASATFFVGFYVYSRGGDMLPYL